VRFCNENNLMISAGSDCHGGFNNRILGISKVGIDKIKVGIKLCRKGKWGEWI
jgi:hypothetical protein